MTDSTSKVTFSRARDPAKKQPSHKKRPSPRQNSRRSPSKAKTELNPAKLPKVRLLLVWGVMVAGCVGLGWRLYQLQVVQGDELRQKARQQQVIKVRPYIPRRTIVDSQGNALATSRLTYSLFVHPKLFESPKEEVATKLAQSLGDTTEQNLLEQFGQQKTGILLSGSLTEDIAEKIKKLNFNGIDVQERYSRFYPQQEMAAEAVGYVDREYKGQAGVESSQQLLLERSSTSFSLRSSRDGTIVPAYLPKNLLNFDHLQLQLTIDLRLQRAARSALKQQLRKYHAKRGAVIVMDATDGSLVTLVCEPIFNPNQYHRSQVELFKNWTVADRYEPGSTFKPINIAIALERGAIEPNSRFYDSGSITVDGWEIYNATREKFGSLSIAEVLQTSSNIAMIQIMNRLSRKDYYKSLQKLELGKRVGIDLPGEVAGSLKSKSEFSAKAIEAATASFGQGFSLTPIKLVQLHGALANGGKLVTPHVVRGLVDAKGHLHWQPSFKTHRIFSSKTSREVVEMMETVVTDGTGKPARIPGYRIAGKTGTAQKAGAGGGYIPGAKITSFVGIFPVESPRYVILVIVDEPKGENTFGSTVAAPVAKLVMEALISLKGMPPSQKVTDE
ncbi:MAG: penicillin-binding protein 2 [Hydrococcus sp. C42_A2020_068]|uniref:peptidoglycan D,D-transpeptidase FtsI family protein n=1 Tax=Pleurocapsa sp. PCC 7327 TaxID=118163 RepID=UPI00029FC68E|nr:penicillin-binding protein 2 [Pleurocapsa sp. PCC 7327]AFY75665.1 cell division protein FtsI/penicillin-binding protein 2 [Pleurocapsa sp. PCC 7327]MBF2019424.1 penicillin-binding protein 2 [Hydrococcus sp. C42_A2020_068]